MKRIFLIFSLIASISISALAQNLPQADVRLYARYTTEYIDNLKVNDPQEIDYLNWYLDNSYSIVYTGLEKCQQMPFLKPFDPQTKVVGESVTEIDEGNFNIFLYDFERKFDKKTYYRIGDTGYAIIIESYKKLAENFNNYQNEK